MPISQLVTLYVEFERECALRKLSPLYDHFLLWIEVSGELLRQANDSIVRPWLDDTVPI